MLELVRLTKRYGRTAAVDGLDLVARPGEVLALLGPNGAGKTTAIRCVTGLIRPSGGRILIGGHDVEREPIAAKTLTGFVPDRAWFYPKVTARELLRYLASVRGLSVAESHMDALLARFRLTRSADSLTETFSHGMRQRLAFCAALIGRPRLFIADEPMVGLDVQGHRDVRLLFRELAADGLAVILTTHTLAVAEEVADRIAVIDRGKLVALGTLTELRSMLNRSEETSLEELFLLLTEPEAVGLETSDALAPVPYAPDAKADAGSDGHGGPDGHGGAASDA
ncbi:MAG: ABC transporter ATP-binding protein [Trueperaceae bacterium]|nr:ABC transporter ATP-binding protein [Trueperaceae bacterium]MCC6312120.1 ABC transporter ATP-binding protein [Trueperaceae bacterium]MCO5173305.1 ABC transporter ATP-binding protein [Trueperaceae bacterium]MCW5818754.1 ABC transporter ATP-binding protein [Trueperaceae bacterium]